MPHVAARRHRIRNLTQELLLLTGLAVVTGAAAWVFTGLAGVLWVVLVVLLLGALRPRVPAAWVLSMYRAQPLPRWVAPQLHEVVDLLAVRAGLAHRPTVFYVPSPVANAFVVSGPDGAALVLTDGLLRLLDGREVSAVVAHEVSHLRNGDTSIMALSDLVARLAQWMGWVGLWSLMLTVPLVVSRSVVGPALLSLVLLLVPIVVTLVQLALSRSREFDADLDAAWLTGDPDGLARALVDLENSDGRIWERILVARSGRPDPLLLQSHPPTEERVRRLLALPRPPDRVPLGERDPFGVAYPPVTDRPRLRRSGIRW